MMVSCHVMDGDDSALKYDSNASQIVKNSFNPSFPLGDIEF